MDDDLFTVLHFHTPVLCYWLWFTVIESKHKDLCVHPDQAVRAEGTQKNQKNKTKQKQPWKPTSRGRWRVFVPNPLHEEEVFPVSPCRVAFLAPR